MKVWVLMEYEGGYEGRDTIVRIWGRPPKTEDITAILDVDIDRAWGILCHKDARWETAWDVEEHEVTP